MFILGVFFFLIQSIVELSVLTEFQLKIIVAGAQTKKKCSALFSAKLYCFEFGTI